MLVKRSLYSRTDIPLKLITLLMQGQVTTAFTGRMSSGKTTAMKAAIAKVDPRLPIRTVESAFELYLREVYPERSLLSMAETPYVSITSEQDALKKADAALTIIGEVATNELAERMISAGMVASIFTIFSHHAITTEALIYSLRNSLMAIGGYSNEAIAEAQVLEVVKADWHLDLLANGNRYVNRCTEIVPLAKRGGFPEYDPKNKEDSMNRIQREYYVRQTETRSFKTVDIMRFNQQTLTYEPCEWFTPELTKNMMRNLNDDEQNDLYHFIHEYWGLV